LDISKFIIFIYNLQLLQVEVLSDLQTVLKNTRVHTTWRQLYNREKFLFEVF